MNVIQFGNWMLKIAVVHWPNINFFRWTYLIGKISVLFGTNKIKILFPEFCLKG
tara:strand:- start:236 stop:397 length:162 start_codon:yes stop_codon:yes gene_type:complete